MGWGEGWGGEKCCALSFILAAHKGSKIKTQAWRGKKNPKFNWPGNRIPGASAFSASREGFRQGHFPALGMKKKIKFGFGLDTNCMPGIQFAYFRGDENLLTSIITVVVQPYEYTKEHSIIHVTWVNFTIYKLHLHKMLFKKS